MGWLMLGLTQLPTQHAHSRAWQHAIGASAVLSVGSPATRPRLGLVSNAVAKATLHLLARLDPNGTHGMLWRVCSARLPPVDAVCLEVAEDLEVLVERPRVPVVVPGQHDVQSA